MEEPFLKKVQQRKPGAPIEKLWCGRVQELCDGTRCADCYMFTIPDIERSSLLSGPTLTDHKKVGLIRDDEDET